jgi:murein DD-endopeptidase MepM/ murein hydrolase activator NlpD
MRTIGRIVLVLAGVAVLGLAGAWIWAGRADGPSVTVRAPGAVIGQAGMLDMLVETPDGALSRLEVTLEQNGKRFTVLAQDGAQPAGTGETANKLFVMRPIGKQALPELTSGKARLEVHASRPVLFGLREAATSVSRDLEVRLDPPRVEVVSSFHFVNHGGSEFVVYRASPADVESGVRVGDKEYRGFPASGIGIPGDPTTRVAFFGLLFEQPLNTPIVIFARDAAGNQASTPLDYRVFPKPYGSSRIQIDDRFLNQVVPAIAAATPGEGIPTGDLVQGFLRINGDLRRKNNQYLRELAAKTQPKAFFTDAFQQLGNSQVEAKFADTRTYVHDGQDIDKQVHLGFDLAVTARVPVLASQRGVVVHASYLGIYGNVVVVDHGLGVQSLYAHMSSFDVKVGDMVEKGQPLGRSGMTGLAGGDHVHFTMLVGGEQVTPVDWWSAQWMQDRVRRKITAAGGV